MKTTKKTDFKKFCTVLKMVTKFRNNFYLMMILNEI